MLCIFLAACGTKALTPLPDQQILTGQKLNQADANFVTSAYQTVQLDNLEGQLAAVHATDPRVRSIAGQLIARANVLYPPLEDAIRVNGITPPTRLPGALQRKVDALGALRGRAFDRAYIADQLESHRAAAATFTEELRRTQDPAMRALAEGALPWVNRAIARLEEISPALP